MFSTGIVLLSTYLLGFITGFGSVLVFGLYRLRKLDRERMKFAQELQKSTKEFAEKAAHWKDRLNKAFDICERQFEILSGIEGPQSGPLHGKHKQQMNAELKRLEEEKMTILKSVLADGYDPKLIMINENGEREAVKLSEFVKRRDLIEQQRGPKKSSASTPDQPKLKLTLVKKDEEK